MLTMRVEGLNAIDDMFNSLPALVNGGVKVVGPAASYALVWELGSIRITKPGPKTVKSVNALGQPAILTITAPNGYIRIHQQEYLSILKEEFGKIHFNDLPVKKWGDALKDMMRTVGVRCAQVISSSAPEDSGNLKASIVAVDPTDDILSSDDSGSYDIGDSWL